MSDKSASSRAVTTAESIYAKRNCLIVTANRPRTSTFTTGKTLVVGSPSVKPPTHSRKNTMRSPWGNETRRVKTTDGETMVLTEARLRSYLLDERGLSPRNAETIMRNIGSIRRAWGITEPTEESALMLKAAMREKERSPNAIRQYMWAMKYWAMADGHNLDFHKVPLPKLEKTVPKSLPFDKVRQIIEDETLKTRDRAIMMLFALTACRNGELESIKVTDIDHKERTILIHDTKTRKEKIAPIPSKYYRLLTEYLDDRAKHLESVGGHTDALIVSITPRKDKEGNKHYDLNRDGIRQALYRIAERYGIDEPPVPGQRRKRNLHPHTMRHTSTSKWMETLGNPEEVMLITGHSTSAMLDLYSHARIERIKTKAEGLDY